VLAEFVPLTMRFGCFGCAVNLSSDSAPRTVRDRSGKGDRRGRRQKRPSVLALALVDRDIIDAGDADPHQAVLDEFPVLVAVAADRQLGHGSPLCCRVEALRPSAPDRAA
jgi:hypothetical protein